MSEQVDLDKVLTKMASHLAEVQAERGPPTALSAWKSDALS